MKNLFKKIFIVLVISFYSANISDAATFNWTYASKAKDDSFELHYDKKTVFQLGDKTFFWQMTNNFKEINNNVYSTIIHNMVKCETYEVKALVYVDFERPMGRGSPTTEAIVPVDFPDYHEWIYYDKNNTVQGQVLSEICD